MIFTVKNTQYWNKKETNHLNSAKKLIFKTVKQYDAALTGLKAQEIDIIRSLPAELFFNQTNSTKFNDNNNKHVIVGPGFRIWELSTRPQR